MNRTEAGVAAGVAGPGLNPMPLNGLEAICRVFGKSRRSVRCWYEAGAPISFDGAVYSSEYNILRAWLNARYSYAARKSF